MADQIEAAGHVLARVALLILENVSAPRAQEPVDVEQIEVGSRLLKGHAALVHHRVDKRIRNADARAARACIDEWEGVGGYLDKPKWKRWWAAHTRQAAKPRVISGDGIEGGGRERRESRGLGSRAARRTGNDDALLGEVAPAARAHRREEGGQGDGARALNVVVEAEQAVAPARKQLEGAATRKHGETKKGHI